MRIVVIGKYPPIEGGVSSETYWLCRQLAEHGHQVHVVTNASEVEHQYRIFLDEDADRHWLEPAFPETGGFVKVRLVEKFSNRRMAHIPQGNPYVSRLASVAAQVCNETNCDVILAYYFEPYGVAAHLVSQWTGIPYVLKHAGSDLDRLMTVPDLAETYRRVVLASSAILTRQDLAGRFLRMGVELSKIVTDLGSYFPPVFEPEGDSLDVDTLCTSVSSSPMRETVTLPTPRKGFDKTVPTIGIYGKIGRAKGSYDLIEALAKAKAQEINFNLLCLSNGVAREDYLRHIAGHNLSDRTWVLPFLPHWRVPEFLRSCTAVCFLERDFPVAIHGPQIPREVMSCGKCLIVSGEIARKQSHIFTAATQDPPIAIVVNDPRDTSDLAEAIIPVLRDPELASRIGKAGYQWVRDLFAASDTAGVLSSLLAAVAGLRPRARGTDDVSMRRVERQMIAAALLPWSSQIIQNAAPELWTSMTDDAAWKAGQHPLKEAINITEVLLSRLGDQEFARNFPPYFSSVLKLEQHQVKIFIKQTVTREPFGHADVLGDRRLTPGLTRDLWPLKDKYCEVHACDYEIADLQRLFETNDQAIEPAKNKSYVLLVPQANFVLKLFRIGSGALRVLELCNGASPVASILDSILAGQNGLRTDQAEKQVLELIGQLYRQTAIAFVSETQPVAKRVAEL